FEFSSAPMCPSVGGGRRAGFPRSPSASLFSARACLPDRPCDGTLLPRASRLSGVLFQFPQNTSDRYANSDRSQFGSHASNMHEGTEQCPADIAATNQEQTTEKFRA